MIFIGNPQSLQVGVSLDSLFLEPPMLMVAIFAMNSAFFLFFVGHVFGVRGTVAPRTVCVIAVLGQARPF